jgi:hypothetical protein
VAGSNGLPKPNGFGYPWFEGKDSLKKVVAGLAPIE